MPVTCVQINAYFEAAFLYVKFFDLSEKPFNSQEEFCCTKLVIWQYIIHSSWGCHLYNLTNIAVQVKVTQFYAKTFELTAQHDTVAYPGLFFQVGFNKFGWGQRAERAGSGGSSPLVRGSALFANEWTPYSYYGLLQMYFPRNWDFGSALSKLRNFGGGGGG
jgi:hypothetical protein